MENGAKYQTILKELDQYLTDKLLSESLYESIKQVLELINQHKQGSEKNIMLENTWQILKQNRAYGFKFDYAPPLYTPPPPTHFYIT